MSDRIELSKIVMRGYADPKIEIEQSVNMCPDDDPVGKPRPMEKVWATDVTPTIERLEEWAKAVRAAAWDEGAHADFREDNPYT